MQNFDIISVLILIITVLGGLGNIISLIVWTKGKRSHVSSCATYFKILSTVDLCLLWLVGTDYMFKQSIRDASDVTCRLFSFFEEFFPQVSSLIATSVSAERMLIVCFPVRFHRSNTRTRTWIVFTVVVLTSGALNILALLTHELKQMPNFSLFPASSDAVEYSDLHFCALSDDYVNEYTTVSTVSYGVFTFLIPLLVIIVCNSIILCKLRALRPVGTNESRQRRTRNVTKIVVCLGLVHCVSTLPRALFWLLDEISAEIHWDDAQVFQNIANVCFFLNSGLNCVVYCLFGSEFRNDIKEIYRRLKNCSGSEQTMSSETELQSCT